MDELARDLGMAKKTIYRQFGAIERTLVDALAAAEGEPFGERVRRFLVAACDELGRIGAAHYRAR